MPPAETSKAENGAPGKSSPSVVAFYKPKASAPKHHHPDIYKTTPKQKSKTPGGIRGFSLLPISNGASSIASALGIRLGATPRERTHLNSQLQFHPTKQDISTLLGLGHFYFALTGGQWLCISQPCPRPAWYHSTERV